MKLAGDIAVEARHQHIRQIIDRSYGLSSLDANDSTIADPGTEVHEKIRRTRKAERARRRRALCDVHARLHREARLAAPGILLAVAQKRIVAQIEAIGPLPRNVEWLHHGGPVNAAWKVPTILTDASLQIELVRHLWLDMKLAGDIAVDRRATFYGFFLEANICRVVGGLRSA